MKLYIMYKIAYVFSPANNFTIKFLISNIKVKSEKMFFFKYIYKHYKFIFIITIFTTVIMINSYILHIIERDIVNNNNFNYFGQSLWSMLITLFTVGFGDVLPKTVYGKIFCLFAGLIGIFFSSIIINIIFDSITPTHLDQKLMGIINSNETRICYMNTARKLVARLFLFSRFKYKLPVNSFFQSKLNRMYFIIYNFKLVKQVKRWKMIRTKAMSYIVYNDLKRDNIHPINEITEKFQPKIDKLSNILDEIDAKQELESFRLESGSDISSHFDTNKRKNDEYIELIKNMKEEFLRIVNENEIKLSKLKNAIDDLNKSANVNLYNNIYS